MFLTLLEIVVFGQMLHADRWFVRKVIFLRELRGQLALMNNVGETATTTTNRGQNYIVVNFKRGLTIF